ncbi:unnamed protein product [Lactuca virosa]|uniref:Uncharacterized protein n=1 Tax=Lactuca virosa TaxID=75947 RepID=A0AAU9LRN8_9ASTR|nr:unnamed protein product [Lactuca virosa]
MGDGSSTTTIDTINVPPPPPLTSPPPTSTIPPTSIAAVSQNFQAEFNTEENDVLDNAIMSGKQFKILNSKMNSILQFLNDSVGKSFVSGFEVKYMLKSQESCIRTLLEDVDKHIDEMLATHFLSFDYELMELQDATRERHVILDKLVTHSKESI